MKSVVEYFRETYGFVIQHTQWPCLQVGNQNRPNYLPMEVGFLLFCLKFLFCICMCLCVCMSAQAFWYSPFTMTYQVCKIVEGQRYSKRLNERQITALLKVTCQRPQERESDILRVCICWCLFWMVFVVWVCSVLMDSKCARLLTFILCSFDAPLWYLLSFDLFVHFLPV